MAESLSEAAARKAVKRAMYEYAAARAKSPRAYALVRVSAKAVDAALDAYREAVARRVRADLLAKVERIPRHDWADGTLIDRNEALAALRAAQDHHKGGPDDGQ